jgi:hypothetical protein
MQNGAGVRDAALPHHERDAANQDRTPQLGQALIVENTHREVEMDATVRTPFGVEQFLNFGMARETTMSLQRDLLAMYARSGQAWLTRAQQEMELWSGLAARVAASRSIPELGDAYRDCLSQRIDMAMDDGRRLFAESQAMMSKITESQPNGWADLNPAANARKHGGSP